MNSPEAVNVTPGRSPAGRPFGKLGAMPHRDNPHRGACDAIEEAVWAHDDFAVRQIRKLGNRTT